MRRRVPLLSPIAEFLHTEAGGGLLLLAATVAALLWANSPWAGSYEQLWHTELSIGVEPLRVSEDLQHWVNDALMTIFFFLIGLEIKRELAIGELRNLRSAAIPAVGALGGMALPAALFLLVSGGGAMARGWGIPMATDIAFAVGVLALLGRRMPGGLKLFLLTLAIIDDIGAIIVIALFYSGGLDPLWLAGTVAALAGVLILRRLGVSQPLAYLPLGVVAWFATYEAGVHPTIAGVALGLMTPAHAVGGRCIVEELESLLHPWSSYVIVPVFALANAGVALTGGAFGAALASRLTWAVVVGLVVGKTLGVAMAALAARRAGVGPLPRGVAPGHVVGAGALAGIGFTVALFITNLAFADTALQTNAKIGILLGSAGSALLGVAVLAGQRLPQPAEVPIPDEVPPYAQVGAGAEGQS